MKSRMPDKFKPAKIQGWISIVGNLCLFFVKIWAGIRLGSVAIMADAWHTLSDTLSSIILLIGVKTSEKPADRRHPFGHGRAELIAAMTIGIMLAAVAVEFFLKGIERIRNPEVTEYGQLGIVVMLLSILFKEAMAQYAFFGARRTGLESLRADGWHHRSDSISSLLLLIGIWFGGQWPYLDGVMAIAVALIIAGAAFGVIRKSCDQILGREIDDELRRQIIDICRATCGAITDAHHFHLHDYGCGRKELTFHIRFSGETSLRDAHQCTQNIENAIAEQTGITATVHAEPLKEAQTFNAS